LRSKDLTSINNVMSVWSVFWRHRCC